MKVPDEKIIAALFECRTNAEAASVVGLSEGQLYKRMQNESFRQKYEQAAAGILERAANLASMQISDSIATLQKVRDSEDTPPQTRVYAADTMLKHTMKIMERAKVEKQENPAIQKLDNFLEAFQESVKRDWQDYPAEDKL